MNNPVPPSGAWLPRNSSSVSERGALFGARTLEAALLLGLGVLVVVLHQSTRYPLGLPGHHGLEWMALLTFGRALSRERHAATLVSLGSAAVVMLPGAGWGGASMGLGYLLAGLALDLLTGYRPRSGVWSAGVFAALAHATKPLWKVLAAAGLGLHFKSIDAGAAYAIGLHLAFGFVGGCAGALAGRTLRPHLLREG